MRVFKSRGFLMPTIVIMLGATTIVLIAVFQYIATTAKLSSEVIYRQVALTAARGALDYGKEQFDTNLSFSGTKDGSGNPAQLTMFTNSNYKVTYQVVVLSTSTDGRLKKVQGIGRVYMPATASAPRYTRIINGEIIRSQIIAQDPSDFSPLAWYDASCNAATSTDPDCASNTVLKTTSGSPTANPSSLREERTNGTFCGGTPQTTSPSNNQLDITTGGECGSTFQTTVGFMFNFGAALPKGATITNATLKLTSNATNSTSKTVLLKGIAADNYPDFTTASGAQLSGAGRTSANISWAMPNWTTVGQTGNSPNIKNIIQEVIDRPGWATGNNIGLLIEHGSGSGVRRAKTTQITLSVTFSGGTAPATSGDMVKTWRDRSGNGFDLTANDANRPTVGTVSGAGASGSFLGKPMLSFTTDSSWMSAAVAASTGREADTYTGFTLMKPKAGTSTTGNGYLVGFYGGGTNGVKYSPFWRHPVSGFHTYDASTGANDNNICVARNTAERVCKTSNPPINSAGGWQVWGSREALTQKDALMRRNGNNTNFGESKFYDPIHLNAPYNIVVGADPQSFTPKSEMEVAEIILYDRELTCPQMESIEQYLATKWSFAGYSSEGCSENNLPAY